MRVGLGPWRAEPLPQDEVAMVPGVAMAHGGGVSPGTGQGTLLPPHMSVGLERPTIHEIAHTEPGNWAWHPRGFSHPLFLPSHLILISAVTMTGFHLFLSGSER